jgi:hypothetical protein
MAVVVLPGGLALDRAAGINMAMGSTPGVDSDTKSLDSSATNDCSLPSSRDSNSSTRQARAVGVKESPSSDSPPPTRSESLSWDLQSDSTAGMDTDTIALAIDTTWFTLFVGHGIGQRQEFHK